MSDADTILTMNNTEETPDIRRPNDRFLTAVELGLPAGFIWMPERNQIHKCNGEGPPTPFCGPILPPRTPEGKDWSWQVIFMDRDGGFCRKFW
mgnify:CR=1 FL=1